MEESRGQSVSLERKVLLMGKENAGKTSMRSIIFANYIARETRRLTTTIGIDQSSMRFVGNLTLNLHDCGGQPGFMDSYLSTERDRIFANVAVLIFIFDVTSDTPEKDAMYYRKSLAALNQHSKEALVFCLLHKMDLIQEEGLKEKFVEDKKAELEEMSDSKAITVLPTSIWDESLYRAWSDIVYTLVPHIKSIEASLKEFCIISGADEVVLFERETFLFICHTSLRQYKDVHRFENISNIIKNFKLSCRKTAAHFLNMEVRNTGCCVFLDLFTTNTYIMVVLSDSAIQSAVTLANIAVARKHFGQYLDSHD